MCTESNQSVLGGNCRWIEVSDEAARRKVRIAFRDKKMKQQKWLQQQQQQQQQREQHAHEQQQAHERSMTIIHCPKHSDIVSGRGLMKNPGNQLFRSIVASKLDDYLNLNQ